MAKQIIQIADKPTEDEILALLKSSEIGLAVLKGLLGQSAGADAVAAIKALLENGTYGLNAIKSAVSGRANETTAAAIKSLLENGAYGLYALKTAITGNLKTIKSVQSGLVATGSSTQLYNITISPVVISKTFVIAQPAQFGLTNGEITKANTVPYAIRLVNSTTVQVASQTSGTKLAWQAVEFY